MLPSHSRRRRKDHFTLTYMPAWMDGHIRVPENQKISRVDAAFRFLGAYPHQPTS